MINKRKRQRRITLMQSLWLLRSRCPVTHASPAAIFKWYLSTLNSISKKITLKKGGENSTNGLLFCSVHQVAEVLWLSFVLSNRMPFYLPPKCQAKNHLANIRIDHAIETVMKRQKICSCEEKRRPQKPRTESEKKTAEYTYTIKRFMMNQMVHN